MAEWPEFKKQMIADFVLEALGGRDQGRLLDFGCGKGALTSILAILLPEWVVLGSDVSENALAYARLQNPDVEFVAIEALKRGSYDAVFTHHVLEHVTDLGATLVQVSSLLKTNGIALHVLPCGNAGSLEYKLCASRPGGVNPDTGKFFFEDPLHERRLTSVRLDTAMASASFKPYLHWFSNQKFGGLRWISSYGRKFIRQVTSVQGSVSLGTRVFLARTRLELLAYSLSLSVLARRGAAGAGGGGHASSTVYLLTPVARALIGHLDKTCRKEWRSSRQDPGGSEMFAAYRLVEEPGNAAS